MGDGVACALAGLGREGRALCDVERVFSGSASQRFQGRAIGAACVRTGQADAAPQVGAAGIREGCYRRWNAFDIGPLAEPKTAAQALVKDVERIAAQALRSRLGLHITLRIEV